MQDRKLICVTQVMDDETGIWANDLIEHGIYVSHLESFLKKHKEAGKKALLEKLDYLKREVELFWEEINQR